MSYLSYLLFSSLLHLLERLLSVGSFSPYIFIKGVLQLCFGFYSDEIFASILLCYCWLLLLLSTTFPFPFFRSWKDEKDER